MTSEAHPSERARYIAFVSYSQYDKRWGRKIHHALETYRVPRGIDLRAFGFDLGRKRTLGKVFRDQEELAGGSSLGAALTGALDDSENLIVLCSPSAAKSRWVNDEIVHFKSRNASDRVLAIILDGEPHASDRGREDLECFPIALRRVVSGSGVVTDERDEPVAPDVRKERFPKVVVRIAAGLLGISFDALWRRERRRRRARLATAVGLGVIAATVVTFLFAQMMSERRSAMLGERDRRISSVVGLLGAENAATAFDRIHQLLMDHPGDSAVLGLSDTVLSWAMTPAESVEGLPSPILYSNGRQTFFKSMQGEHLPLGASLPLRRIGFPDGRMVLIYRDRVVLMDMAAAHIIDELAVGDGVDLRNYQWDGLAFQSPSGTAVVAGRHQGISNSRFWDAFLTYSGVGESLNVLVPLEHPDASDLWRSRYADRVRFFSDCRILGIPEGSPSPDSDDERDLFFLLTLEGDLDFAGMGVAAPGRSIEMLPSREDPSMYRIMGPRAIEEAACVFPSFDTLVRSDLAGPDGLIVEVDPAFSPVGAADWSLVEATPPDLERGFRAGHWTNRPAAPSALKPCSECPIVDGPWKGQEVSSSDFDSPGWVTSSMPPAGRLEGPWAESFERSPLWTFHAQHNAGIESAWCRRLDTTGVGCLSFRVGMEFRDDWSAIDLRSRSGRYVFYNPGAGVPFELFDVLKLRVVTPESPRLPVRIGAATFSNDPDDRLFLVSDGRLHVLEPSSTGGRFHDMSEELSWNRAMGEMGDGDRVVSVIALPSDYLAVIRENGMVSRLHWPTGTILWSHGVPGVGLVREVRRSSAADHLLVIGTRGLRLVRSSDGLLQSGVLVPPHIFDPAADRTECSSDIGSPREIRDLMSDATVEAGPEVIVRCGRRRQAWRPRPFSGNRIERLTLLRSVATDSDTGERQDDGL